MKGKICFFIASINHSGGTERVCAEIANRLAKLGYQVTILSMYGTEPFFTLDSRIRVTSIFQNKYKFKWMLPLVIVKIRNKIRSIDPDYLVNADSALFIYSYIAGLKLSFKNLVWEHFNFNYSAGAKVRVISRRLAAKLSSGIITLTRKDAENWKKKLDCRVPVFTINNPTPFINDEIDYKERKNIALAVGRLTYQKGFDRLLDSWKIVSQSCNDWELHIVGSGDQQNALIEQANALNIANSVTFIPATPHIEQHYRQAAIYCLSSRFEGFPMVLLEAQSFGLPAVSYDCETGPSEIINDNNGILVPDGDRKLFAEVLIYLIKNADVRAKMSESALEHSVQYHIDVIIKEWLLLFNYNFN
jgi:glycosyltransferase involved in cell wall biosynthesis